MLRGILPLSFVALAILPLSAPVASPPRPILITVDDLPIAADSLHPDPAERDRITRGMLQALAKHRITAVGLVAGKHHPKTADEHLLDLWVRAGHGLGNHSFSHLNYSETGIPPYIADVEKERAWLAGFLKAERRRREVPAAVKTALDAQVAAWNRGDLEAFVDIYAEDVSFVSPSGIAHGRREVLGRYRRRYPDRKAMGTLSLEITGTRVIAGEEFTLFGDTVVGRVQGATVIARWTLSYEDKPPLTGSTLLVLRPRGETWEIVQDASM